MTPIPGEPLLDELEPAAALAEGEPELDTPGDVDAAEPLEAVGDGEVPEPLGVADGVVAGAWIVRSRLPLKPV